MRTTILLLTLLLLMTVQAAVPVGGVRINSDSTGTNTRSSSITVTLQTNLNSGVVNATNSVNVGQAGQAGVAQISSATSSNYLVITMTPTNALFGVNATDETDNGAFTFIATNILADADLFAIYNSTNRKVHIYQDGTLFARRLFAEDLVDPDYYTRIQPGTDLTIRSGPNTNRIVLDGGGGSPSMTMTHEGTNTFFVAVDSGYLGGGTNFLSDDGTYKALSSGAAVNPTVGFHPYNQDGSTFGDGSWYYINNERVGFVETNSFITADSYGENTGVGRDALLLLDPNLFPSFNVALGKEAGRSIVDGSWNTLIGHRAGWAISSAGNNTFVGYTAGATATGSDDTALGSSALLGLTTGSGNIGIGTAAGLNTPGVTLTTGSSNIFIGLSTSGGSASINNSIAIGTKTVVTNSHEIVIGNTLNTKVIFPITSYAGGGTKVLTDDGTYKAVSGLSSLPGQIGAACSDETTALTTGTNKVRFRMPYAMTVTAVRASLTTAQTGGSILTVDINENGTSILSTKITIDDNETTSTTAATPPVISDSALADDAIITVDIDQVGTSPAGLKIWIIGTY